MKKYVITTATTLFFSLMNMNASSQIVLPIEELVVYFIKNSDRDNQNKQNMMKLPNSKPDGVISVNNVFRQGNKVSSNNSKAITRYNTRRNKRYPYNK